MTKIAKHCANRPHRTATRETEPSVPSAHRTPPACPEGVRSATRLRIAFGLLLLAAPLFLPAQSSAQDFITTIAGDDISGSSFNLPTGVAVDSYGNLYVADAQNCMVWVVANGVATALAGVEGNCTAGTGSGAAQSLAYPIDVASCGGNVYFATHGVESSSTPGGIFEIAANATFSTLLLPTAAAAVSPFFPVAIACDSNLNVYVSSIFYTSLGLYGSVDEIPAGSTTTTNLIQTYGFAYPGITVDSLGHVFALEVGASAGWTGTASLGTGYLYELTGGTAVPYLQADIPSGLPNPARLVSNGPGTFLITAAAPATTGKPPTYVLSVPGLDTSGLASAIAGNGTQGYKGDGGQATNAELNNASALAVDSCGSVYVADSGNNVVRKVFNPNRAGTAPCVTGTGTSPNVPSLYASLTLVQSNGQITAPGSITFYSSVGISNCSSNCVGSLQGEVFFCVFSTTDFVPANSPNSIPCQDGATLGTVAVNSTSGTTGNAGYQASFLIPGTFYVAAEFFDPPYLPYTTVPETVTVCGASCSDSGVPNTPVATWPVAFTPGALSRSLYSGNGMVALDAKGNEYFLNGSAGTVILVDTQGGTSPIVSSSTAVSTGGTLGTMNNLGDIVVGSDSNLYITDTGNNRVIQVESPASGSPTVNVINIGSTGGALSPPLTAPMGIFETNSEVYVTDSPSTGPRLVAFEPNGGYPTVLLGSATAGAPALGQLLGVVVNPTTATIYLANAPVPGNTTGGNILKISSGGTPTVIATPGTTLQSPYGLAMDAAGGVYFSDTGTHQVYRMDIHGNVIVVAGNGTATESLANLILGQTAVSATQTGLADPTWLALDPSNSIYMLDGSQLLYLNVTESIVDFTATGQSQTIYVTNPVAGTQGSVESEFGSPLLSGTSASDFTVDTTGTCSRTSSNLLSPNTSCTLAVTLSSGGSNTSATACTLSEIEVSLGPPPSSGSCAVPPAGLTSQTITLNSITAPATSLQITGTAVQGTYNVVYSPVAFLVTGGSGQYTISESGTLPQGITFSGGVLSGMPLQGGVFPFTVTATDSVGDSGSLVQTLVIDPAPTMTGATASPNPVGITQPMTLTATVLYNGSQVTSGSVTFTNYSTDTQLGTVPLTSSGQASLPIDSPGTAGTYQYEATFNGTANLAQSSSMVFVTVTSVPTTVTIPTIMETILVADTPTFPDVFDAETINVTDTPLVVAEPAQLSIAVPVAYYSVGSLGFGTVAAGRTVTQSFSLANIGEAPLSLTGDSFNSGASFSLSQTLCTYGASSLPTTLPPSSACVFTITYTAPASGTPATDAISFTDNAALSNASSIGSGSSYTQTIPLNGSGASTPPGAPPATTVTIPTITESIMVTDTPTFLVSQIITATPPEGAKDKDTFTVSASGGASGNPLVFTSSGDCTNSGAIYTMGNKAGTCAGTITQAGNSNYSAATPYSWNTIVSTTLTKPGVTFTGALSSAAGGSSFVVTATYPETQGVPVEVPTITATGSCTAGAVSGGGNTYQATITMTKGSGTCATKATWAANFYYASATETQKTTGILITPTASFTGAPTSEADGIQFTVSASSDETGNYASVPTITASGACTAGTIAGSNGTYQTTITMTKSSGTCTTTAKWAASIEYDAVKLTQSTTAEK